LVCTFVWPLRARDLLPQELAETLQLVATQNADAVEQYFNHFDSAVSLVRTSDGSRTATISQRLVTHRDMNFEAAAEIYLVCCSRSYQQKDRTDELIALYAELPQLMSLFQTITELHTVHLESPATVAFSHEVIHALTRPVQRVKLCVLGILERCCSALKAQSSANLAVLEEPLGNLQLDALDITVLHNFAALRQYTDDLMLMKAESGRRYINTHVHCAPEVLPVLPVNLRFHALFWCLLHYSTLVRRIAEKIIEILRTEGK
jgi:hypothetical protein